MPALAIPEEERLASLRRLDILDTPPEPEFDELVKLAATICEMPVGLITLLDESRQWFKASFGVAVRETSRESAFCNHTLKVGDLLIIEDATADARLNKNPDVTGGQEYRFYAGIPVTTSEGHTMGSLCVLDYVPRTLSTAQIATLRVLSHQVNARLELRQQRIALETSLRATEQALQKLAASEARFQTFMDSSPLLSYLKDADGRFLFYNRNFADHFGITREEWLGRSDTELFSPEVAASYRANDLQVLESEKLHVVQETTHHEDAPTTHWRSYKFPFHDGNVLLLGGVSVDITAELKRDAELQRYRVELEYANALLHQQATTDALTSLPNRRAVEERLSQDLARARRNQSPLSVILLDVDNFKRCNDIHGHHAGDMTLCHLARVLRSTLRQTDLVARYGGEEFLIVLPETGADDAMLLAMRLTEALHSTSWPVVHTTVSGGIASLNSAIDTQECLVSKADEALYQAKRLGKDRVIAHGFSSEMSAASSAPTNV